MGKCQYVFRVSDREQAASKNRIAKEIIPFLMKHHNDENWYIEPFVGGCNIIDKVPAKRRWGNDNHYYLIEMWKWLTEKTPICIPQSITKEQYYCIKNNQERFPNWLVGYVGFNCSYSGKWFGGYAGKTKTKIGTERDYQKEAYNNMILQIEKLIGVKFTNKSYADIEIPHGSTVYCDIPYVNTTKYKSNFNHELFWNWAREVSLQTNLFVSEYSAPDDFIEVWEKTVKSSLSANGVSGGNKLSVEKLFVHESRIQLYY